MEKDVIVTFGDNTFDVTVFVTKAVVASCVVDVPIVAVGAVGIPVNAVFISEMD